MGGNYYYFCSQLPALQPGAVPPFTLAEFDERVAGILPPADFAYVSRCGFPPDRGADLPAGSVGAAYRSWEFALRGEIARLRVAEGHGDAIDLPPETDAFADIREQIGGAACHEGYRSCFFRKYENGELKVIGERVFDPAKVYKK